MGLLISSASLTNFVLSNTALSTSGTAVNTNEIEADYGDTVAAEVRVQSLNGAPATATLVMAWQLAPVEYNGYNMNWEPSGDQIVWQTTTSTDNLLGKNLPDGDWTNFTQAQTFPLSETRRLIVPPLFRLIRLSLTPTFSGGTTPNFTVSVVMSVPNRG